jgi:hypothetical protein
MTTTLKFILYATIATIVLCPLMYLGEGGLQVLGVLIYTAAMLVTPVMHFIPKLS